MTLTPQDIAEARRVFESPTWPYVEAFAFEMEKKLALNRHKGDREGWATDSPESLLVRLREETEELAARLDWVACGCRSISECNHYTPEEEPEQEAADVGNFAMMIADVAGAMRPTRILPLALSEVERLTAEVEKWKDIAKIAHDNFGFADVIVFETGNTLKQHYDEALAGRYYRHLAAQPEAGGGKE
jgi:hypothetical protein